MFIDVGCCLLMLSIDVVIVVAVVAVVVVGVAVICKNNWDSLFVILQRL